MKLSNIALSLALIGTMSLGMAEETTTSAETTTTTETTVNVDTEIAEIQAAPAQERVRLMNQFKQRLATMNEADRAAAIEQLQTRMQTRTQDATAENEEAVQAMTQTRTRTQTRTQEHAQEMQMQTNEQMIQMQNMNQNRAGNQFMNGGASVSGGVTSPMSFPNR
jgi:cell division protein FtsX